MKQPTLDDDALLTRKQLALALASRGFPVTAPTLATKATRGGGPPYAPWGGRVLYRWRDAIDWAEARLGDVRCTTSEADIPVINGRSAGSNSMAPVLGSVNRPQSPTVRSLTITGRRER